MLIYTGLRTPQRLVYPMSGRKRDFNELV
jgi:hypothetical protein